MEVPDVRELPRGDRVNGSGVLYSEGSEPSGGIGDRRLIRFMGMRSAVYGIKPQDEKFAQMYKVWCACTEAKIAIPEVVRSFFGGDPPNPKGVVVRLDGYAHNAVRSFVDDNSEGFEVDLEHLSKDFKLLRFVNSW